MKRPSRFRVDGSRLSLLECETCWLVVDGDQVIAGPFRTKGEALSAAVAAAQVADLHPLSLRVVT